MMGRLYGVARIKPGIKTGWRSLETTREPPEKSAYVRNFKLPALLDF